jgi:hypothetical protein
MPDGQRGTLDMAEGGSDEKASGSPPAVFISYASQDVAVASAVVEALESHGIKRWIALRDVVPGEFYAGAIVHAIDAAKVGSKRAPRTKRMLCRGSWRRCSASFPLRHSSNPANPALSRRPYRSPYRHPP